MKVKNPRARRNSPPAPSKLHRDGLFENIHTRSFKFFFLIYNKKIQNRIKTSAFFMIFVVLLDAAAISEDVLILAKI